MGEKLARHSVPAGEGKAVPSPLLASRNELKMADMAPDDTLTPRQYKAIAALLAAASIRQAAVDADIPEKTIYNWLRDARFQAAYSAARREAVQQAIARLQRSATAAVSVLLMLMAKDTTPAAVRLQAAGKVLDLALQGVTVDDLIARIEALEREPADA